MFVYGLLPVRRSPTSLEVSPNMYVRVDQSWEHGEVRQIVRRWELRLRFDATDQRSVNHNRHVVLQDAASVYQPSGPDHDGPLITS